MKYYYATSHKRDDDYVRRLFSATIEDALYNSRDEVVAEDNKQFTVYEVQIKPVERHIYRATFFKQPLDKPDRKDYSKRKR